MSSLLEKPFLTKDIEKGTKRIGDIIAENNEIIKSKLREINLSLLDAVTIEFIPVGYDNLVSFDLHEQTQFFI